MQSFTKVFKKGSKRVREALGQEVSVSPPQGFEYDPHNPGEYRKIQARSPPFSGYQQESDRYYEMKRLTREEEEAVNNMIEQINIYFRINVDTSDGNIRFIIRKIISVHGLTSNCIELIQRCRPLLYAISDVIARSATTASLEQQVRNLGPIFERLAREAASLAAQSLRNTALYASSGMSRGLDFLMSRGLIQQEPSGRSGRARSISPVRNERVEMMHGAVLATINFTTQALSGLCSMLLNILKRASNILARCVAAGTSMVASGASRAYGEVCAYLTPQQAVEEAVEQAGVPEAPDLKCSICISDAIGQGAMLTQCGHRFHAGCIMPWLSSHNTCPNCRQIAIPTRPAPVPRQGGGGLRKYRSKTRSKSKSRRYISKPQKSRKARKRIRHSSSRRK